MCVCSRTGIIIMMTTTTTGGLKMYMHGHSSRGPDRSGWRKSGGGFVQMDSKSRKNQLAIVFFCVCWMRKTKSHEADEREFDKNLSSSSSSSSLQSPRWSGNLCVFVNTYDEMIAFSADISCRGVDDKAISIGLPGFCIFFLLLLLLWSFHGHSQFIP